MAAVNHAKTLVKPAVIGIPRASYCSHKTAGRHVIERLAQSVGDLGGEAFRESPVDRDLERMISGVSQVAGVASHTRVLRERLQHLSDGPLEVAIRQSDAGNDRLRRRHVR